MKAQVLKLLAYAMQGDPVAAHANDAAVLSVLVQTFHLSEKPGPAPKPSLSQSFVRFLVKWCTKRGQNLEVALELIEHLHLLIPLTRDGIKQIASVFHRKRRLQSLRPTLLRCCSDIMSVDELDKLLDMSSVESFSGGQHLDQGKEVKVRSYERLEPAKLPFDKKDVRFVDSLHGLSLVEVRVPSIHE